MKIDLGFIKVHPQEGHPSRPSLCQQRVLFLEQGGEQNPMVTLPQLQKSSQYCYFGASSQNLGKDKNNQYRKILKKKPCSRVKQPETGLTIYLLGQQSLKAYSQENVGVVLGKVIITFTTL